ncbi:diaminopimelate decarboxylase [Planotetraspora phitsanulokensis]|uniref:Diaminopimelate decarboxylase n=1 Tax=Planotetraspora phitsanulokensis TaxID=575192 RepID=A0A8J3XK16_9ACTN|nr:diaminopimelate decarboxylase [Planotetraspora phitsanulokensis]GII39093.1 diaminopimelate decarboxylase [Planotetraspora phitsanulokensis]
MTVMTETAHGPWSATTRFRHDGTATVGNVSLMEIVHRFGTPLYVIDETDVRLRARAYRAALPSAEIAYAAKAFLCRAMASWLSSEGLSLDVCSAGELAVARSVGFPASKIIFHGNAKTPHELHLAVEQRVGRIVVDSVDEIHRLAALVPAGYRQKVLIRVIPDIEAGESAAVRTGGENQKFGLSVATGGAGDAVSRVLRQPRLQLVGLHCHLGSQITSVEPFERAARAMIEHLAGVWKTHGVALPQLDLGGGHGIAYRPGDSRLNLDAFAARVTDAVEERAAGLGLPVPRLTIEPGRAIAGTAGVTLYRVISVKKGLGHTYVAVDGGMSDNPRPALYGSRYEVKLIGRASHEGDREVTVVGHHCEAGDVIAEDVPLPADLHPGDVLAVAATGAYHHSMASTYNLTCRPPVVAVGQSKARLVVRRESLEDLTRRDVGL